MVMSNADKEQALIRIVLGKHQEVLDAFIDVGENLFWTDRSDPQYPQLKDGDADQRHVFIQGIVYGMILYNQTLEYLSKQHQEKEKNQNHSSVSNKED
jgi:hypothetical protein